MGNASRNRTGKMSLFLCLLSGVLLSLTVEGQQLPPEVIAYADTVLHNGKILTADDSFTIAQAVAIRDGKFLAVGQNNRILAMAGPGTKRIDLEGKTVTPGFLDTHFHADDYALRDLLLEGKNITWQGKVIRAALWWDTVEIALIDIRKAAQAASPGELIWLPTRFESEHVIRALRMEDVDAATPHNPLLLSSPVRLRPWAANSRALKELVPIPADAKGFPRGGGAAVTDEVALILHDYVRWAIPIEEQIPWHKRRMEMANAVGLTLAVTRVEPAHLTAIREIWQAGEMTLRLRAAIQVLDAAENKAQAEKILRSMGNLSGIGDGMLEISGISAGGAPDGGPFMGSAWTWEPKLQELPGLPDRPYGRDTWYGRDKFVLALRYGWNISNTHSAGDRATSEMLSAYEEAINTLLVKSSSQRLTIDHLVMVRPQDIQKMKELGVIPSISPWFVFSHYTTDRMITQYGKDRVDRMMPMKSYIQAGIRPSLEADSGEDPLARPLYKVQKAVTRKDDQGRTWGETEKVTRQEALWMTTNWSAYYTGDQDRLGTIEAGKLADLVVLGKDYMSVPEDEIADIPVVMTLVGGKIVFEGSFP